MPRYRHLFLLFSLLISLLLLTVAPTPIRAASGGTTFTVTRLDDPTPNGCQPTDCSLREAIIAADADVIADKIEFELDGTIELSIAPTGDNDATSGDLNITNPLIVEGRGAFDTMIDANNLDRVFHIMPNPNCDFPNTAPIVWIEDVTITGGTVTGNGGGILVDSCLALNDVILRDNHATGNGGGIYGWLYNYSINNSAVIDNSAMMHGGGAAVYDGVLTVNHSTFSGNDATLSGGGLVAMSSSTLIFGSTLNLNNNTIVYNHAGEGTNGAGFALHYGNPNIPLGDQSVYPANNIFAYNTGGRQCGFLDEGSPRGVNVATDNSCEGAVQADPLLNALADNGGDTYTHALQVNSPAIDAGNCDGPTDQRGLPRPVDLPDYPNAANGCDLGAYELQEGSPTAVTVSSFESLSPTVAPAMLPLLIGLSLLIAWKWKRP